MLFLFLIFGYKFYLYQSHRERPHAACLMQPFFRYVGALAQRSCTAHHQSLPCRGGHAACTTCLGAAVIHHAPPVSAPARRSCTVHHLLLPRHSYCAQIIAAHQLRAIRPSEEGSSSALSSAASFCSVSSSAAPLPAAPAGPVSMMLVGSSCTPFL